MGGISSIYGRASENCCCHRVASSRAASFLWMSECWMWRGGEQKRPDIKFHIVYRVRQAFWRGHGLGLGDARSGMSLCDPENAFFFETRIICRRQTVQWNDVQVANEFMMEFNQPNAVWSWSFVVWKTGNRKLFHFGLNLRSDSNRQQKKPERERERERKGEKIEKCQ